MMQIPLDQAPPYFWSGLMILVLAVAYSIAQRAYTKHIATRNSKEVALAALQANTEKSTPSKRTASK